LSRNVGKKLPPIYANISEERKISSFELSKNKEFVDQLSHCRFLKRDFFLL